jgi:hypothetical protein
MGDNINATLTINSQSAFESVVSIYLECPGSRVEVYKEFLSLSSPAQKEVVVPLVKSLIGYQSGICRLEAYEDNVSAAVSGNFGISNSITVDLLDWGSPMNPGQEINFTGSAIKQDGRPANGFYSARIDNTTLSGNVKDGVFNLELALPSDSAAGQHELDLNVSEEDSSGNIVNSGSKIYFINVNHVPTNVEVLLDNTNVTPGKSISGKIILHDQTGEDISGGDAYVAVKDSSGAIVGKIATKTGDKFSYPINSTEPPSIFTVSAYADGIINSAYVNVLENREVTSDIINNTLLLTNTGNVFYNDTLLVRIGEDNVSVPVSLGVGMSQKYIISAPDGEYNVSVGSSHSTVFLSGNAVDLQKVDEGNLNVNILIWVFLIVILALGLYFMVKRNYKKKFVTKKKILKNSTGDFVVVRHDFQKGRQAEDKVSQVPPADKSAPLFNPGRKVEISLSISGTKQNSSVGCISFRNYPEISSGEGNVRETLSKVKEAVEDSKGFVYQNGSYLFFIFAPSFTRTFKNQKEAVAVGKKIKRVLDDHNKKFRKKIEYGLSLNYGPVITKLEHNVIKFMSLGTIMISAKKIANSSDGSILISERFKENLEDGVKGSPMDLGGMKAYKLDNLVDKNSHSTFLSGFLARQEKERQKSAEEKKPKTAALSSEDTSVIDGSSEGSEDTEGIL